MDISLDHDADTPNAIKWNFYVLVVAEVTHLGHIDALCTHFLVAYVSVSRVTDDDTREHAFSDDDILVERCCEFQCLLGLLPRVVVKATLDILAILVSVEPDIWNECQLRF